MQLRFYSLNGVELFARVAETVRYKNYLIYIVKFCGKLYAVWNNLTLIEANESTNVDSFKNEAIGELKN
jgi:hypothetical protein